MPNHNDDCCHTTDIHRLCTTCKTDYEDYLDHSFLSDHDQYLAAMDDFLTKLETEGIFYGYQSKVG